MMRKPTLGRGLADLLGQGRPLMAPAPAAPEHHAEELAKLPLDLLQRGRYQPRMDMRTETLAELADSIKAQGVVQPIVVRPVDTPGQRRLAALRDHRRGAPLARSADGRIK